MLYNLDKINKIFSINIFQDLKIVVLIDNLKEIQSI
jgi:hypothetical protein